MANYNGSLEAVDCHIHSVRYDMVFESRAGGRLRCFISCCGLPYSQREIRYGRQQRSWRPTQTPHQVTYDVAATPIGRTNA
eukprot:scaffold18093_cov67-Skeletonema_dohrnii-CCMP3373.AAC.1